MATEKQSVKAEGKTRVYERGYVTSPSTDLLVVRLDPVMEFRMCDEVNRLDGLLVVVCVGSCSANPPTMAYFSLSEQSPWRQSWGKTCSRIL